MANGPIQPQPGSSLDVSDIVGRRNVTEAARRELRRGANLLLNDPRRMGKTVWLDLFATDPGDGFLVVKVDFEGVQTSDEFVVRLVEALQSFASLPARARGRLSAMFEGVDEVAGGLGPVKVKAGLSHRSPTDLLALLTRDIDQHLDAGTTLVVAMDEVPAAVGNVTATEGASSGELLLQSLRHVRLDCPNLRWILAGSIGFHHVIRHCGATSGVVNDLVNLRLGPLTDTEAAELARRLVAGIGREPTPKALTVLTDITDGIPFLMHAVVHRIEDTSDNGPLEAHAVETAFEEFVADRDDSRAATHLVDRLDVYYGNDGPLADSILDTLALEGPLTTAGLESRVEVPDAEALRRVLDALADDHYLTDENRLSWRYNALRKVWVRRRRLA